MAKVTQRPYVPCGDYDSKRAAERAAKQMSESTGQRWIACKSPAGEGFGIVRKD